MKSRFSWWILLLALLLINAWTLKNRNNGFKYYPYRTYSDLYTTDSTLYLTSILFNGDLLQLGFSMPLSNTNLKLFTDSSYTTEIKPGNKSLSLPLEKGLHTYNVILSNEGNTIPISISVDHAPRDNHSYDNEFVSSNLPGPDVEPIPLNTWRIDESKFPKGEVEQARQLLKGAIHILPNDDDSTKIIKIGKYIRHLPNDPKATNPSEIFGKSPWQTIQLAQRSTACFNCGNYAAMFYFLGGLAGLVTRGITYSGPDGNWHYPTHYMNEVYLHNKQQWGLVDNLYNIYLPHDSTRFYNAADVKKMSDINGFSDKVCYDLNNDSIKIIPYKQVSHIHSYYNLSSADVTYAHDASYKFSWFNNLWQFYIPLRSHDFYSDRKTNNIGKLVVKTISILALILFSFVYLAWELRHRKSK